MKAGLGFASKRGVWKESSEEEKPDVVFLSKTKSPRTLMKKLLSDFPNIYLIDPRGKAGGLALAWVDGFHSDIVYENNNNNVINVLIKTNFCE